MYIRGWHMTPELKVGLNVQKREYHKSRVLSTYVLYSLLKKAGSDPVVVRLPRFLLPSILTPTPSSNDAPLSNRHKNKK